MSNTPAHLLVIWHSRTGASEAMARAAAKGAGEGAKLMRARDITADALLAAGGYLFICPENLASMSGEMKEMFDVTYYDVLTRIEGRPYATVIAAGSDGENAQRQLDRIAIGWRLKRVAKPRIVNFSAQSAGEIWAEKDVPSQILTDCERLGEALVEGIQQGIF